MSQSIDKKGYWIAHVDVSWVEGGDDLENEVGKYDSSGSLQWHRPPYRSKQENSIWGRRTHMKLPRALHDAGQLSLEEEEPWA